MTITGQRLDGTPATIEHRQTELEAVHRKFWPPRSEAPSTGHAHSGNGMPASLDDAEIIRRAGEAKNGAKFKALWAGSTHGYPSASEADLALASRLAFWCGPDPDHIDALYRQSGLFRSKWQRDDYRKRTLDKALAGRTEFYEPRRKDTPPRNATSAATSSSGISVARGQGYRPPEAYRPFPMDALPAPLTEYVRQGALALGCDAAYLALPILAVAASALGNTRKIRLKRGWDEPSIVWAALVGDSGSLKTPAYQKGVGYLFRLQKRMRDEYRKEMAAYKEAKRKAKDDEDGAGEQPQEPVLQRVVCSDTTIEKLAEILEDNPRGVLVARDELAGWLASFSRYKQKGGTDLPNWLEMHQAGTIVVDRKTGEHKTQFVSFAAVSVTGGIQPGVLARSLTPEFLESGLAARVLMAMPPRRPKRWSEVEISEDAENAYHKLLDDLLALDFARDTQGEKVPHVLRLAPDAKKLWVEFFNSWGQEQAAAEGELATAYSKLEAYAARFALLHHVITQVWLAVDDRREVDPKSVEAGIRLARWFAAEARRIYATLAESTEQRETRRLVEWVRSRPGGEVTTKELQRSNSRKYPTAEVAATALDALVVDGLGRWEEKPSGPQGGRPTRVFILSLIASDETDQTDQTTASVDARAFDETPDPSDDTPQIHEKNGVSSVSSVVGHNVSEPNHPPRAPLASEWVSSDEKGVSSDSGGGWTAPGYEDLETPFDN